MSAQPRFFGAFLVMKKIITADQLVSALITQAAEAPSTFQIIYDSKLLSADDWLKVFDYQMSHKVEFKAACQALGFWTPAIEAQLQSTLQKTKTPLGHILLKQQATDLSTLTKALDEFLASASKPSETMAQDSSPKAQPTGTSVGGSAQTQSAPRAFEFVDLDDSILGDFSDFFSSSKVAGLVDLSKRAAESGGDKVQLGNLVSEIATQSHMLKGVAVCLRLPVITELLTYIEHDCLRGYRQEGRTPTQEDLENCRRAFQALILVRERILADRSEMKIWEEVGANLDGIFKKVLV